MKQKSKEFFCFGLFLLLILLGFYSPWITHQQAFYLSDLTYYFEPLSRFIGETLRQGRLPLWNPYSFCGMPQIAIPSPGIFYPLAWLFAFFPFTKALALSMVLHQLIAGIGSYLLIVSLGWGVIPALVFGFTMALCGYMFSLQANYTLINTAAWIPLCLWALAKIDATRSKTNAMYFLIAVVSCFMMVAAGRPEVSVPGILLLFAYILISYIQHAFALINVSINRLHASLIMGLRLCALIFGGMIAAPILLPMAEWALLSTRSHGLASHDVFLWSANWYDFIVMVLAHPLGDLHILSNKFLVIGASRAAYIPYVSSAFIGPIVLTLAFWGIFDRTWKHRLLILGFMLCTLIMALGNYTPIAPWLISQSSILSVFRYPEKLLIFFTGAVAFMAARGAYLFSLQQVNRAGAFFAWAFWTVWSMVSLLLLLVPNLSKWILLTYKLTHPDDWSLITQSQLLIGQAGLAAGLIGLGLCLLYCCNKNMNSKTSSIVLLSALLATLITSAVFTSRHGTEPEFFNYPAYLQEIIARLNNQSLQCNNSGKRVLSLCFDPLAYPNGFNGFKNEQPTPSFYQYGRQMLLPNTHIDARLPSSYGYEGAETADYRKLFWKMFKQSHAFIMADDTVSGAATDLPLYRFCQLTSTKYVYTQVSAGKGKRIVLPFLDKNYFDLKYTDQTMNVRVYAVIDSLPRVYFSKNWIWTNSSKDSIDRIIGDHSFDPLQKAFISTENKTSTSNELNSAQDHVVNVVNLHIAEPDPEHLNISLKLEKNSMIILADHYYPGWEAKLDGTSTPIYCANGVLKAVYVPAGSHEINFVYKPQSLIIGFLLATIAIVFSVVVALVLAFDFARLKSSSS